MIDRERPEEGLSTTFGELRAAREREAGTFQTALTRGRARRRLRQAWVRRRLSFALAAGIPLLGVLAADLRERERRRQALELAQQAAAILEWRSPTASFMSNAYAAWLAATPSLGSSLIDSPSILEGGSQ
jgi:hypothetical protein